MNPQSIIDEVILPQIEQNTTDINAIAKELISVDQARDEKMSEIIDLVNTNETNLQEVQTNFSQLYSQVVGEITSKVEEMSSKIEKAGSILSENPKIIEEIPSIISAIEERIQVLEDEEIFEYDDSQIKSEVSNLKNSLAKVKKDVAKAISVDDVVKEINSKKEVLDITSVKGLLNILQGVSNKASDVKVAGSILEILNAGSNVQQGATRLNFTGGTLTYTNGTVNIPLSGGSPLVLRTNGTNNGSQTLLNLKQGTNITLADDGVGGVTINSTGGGGGVSTVSVVTANGVSGTVANPTTTPAITLSLGAITPSSVASTGTVTGTNLSGTNTGDNAVNSLYSGLVSNATHTGDATGSTALTLATVNSNVGSFTNANVTVNAKGLVTAASSGTAPVTSVGATGPITSSGGTTPIISTSMATGKLIGRSTAGTGAMEEITLGTNLSFTGTTLNAAGGGGGSPGGSTTQVQYNNAGSFGGITGATTNGTTLTLVSPVLGTPASVTLTNATGTATGLTSGVTNALKTATTTVDVSASSAPTTGQVLTATSSTTATWQTPTGGGGSAFSGVRATQSSGQAISASTLTAVQFDTNAYDTDVYHVPGNPTRVTMPTTGYYHVSALFNTDGNAVIYGGVRLNGSTYIATSGVGNAGASTANGISLGFDYYFTAGDYIELMGTFGTAQFTKSGVSGTQLEVHRLAGSTNSNVAQISMIIGDGVNTISTNATSFPIPCTFAGTITGYTIAADAGTATIKTWKKATGTAIPTIADVISTSGVDLSTGTLVRSATVSDFTTTTVTANDVFMCQATAVATAKYLVFTLEIQKS